MLSVDGSGGRRLACWKRVRKISTYSCLLVWPAFGGCHANPCLALVPDRGSGTKLGLSTATILLLTPSQLRAVDPKVQTVAVPGPLIGPLVVYFEEAAITGYCALGCSPLWRASPLPTCLRFTPLRPASCFFMVCHSAFKRFMIVMTWPRCLPATSCSTRSWTTILNPRGCSAVVIDFGMAFPDPAFHRPSGTNKCSSLRTAEKLLVCAK